MTDALPIASTSRPFARLFFCAALVLASCTSSSAPVCGQQGEPCCGGLSCTDGLLCLSDVCSTVGSSTSRTTSGSTATTSGTSGTGSGSSGTTSGGPACVSCTTDAECTHGSVVGYCVLDPRSEASVCANDCSQGEACGAGDSCGLEDEMDPNNTTPAVRVCFPTVGTCGGACLTCTVDTGCPGKSAYCTDDNGAGAVIACYINCDDGFGDAVPSDCPPTTTCTATVDQDPANNVPTHSCIPTRSCAGSTGTAASTTSGSSSGTGTTSGSSTASSSGTTSGGPCGGVSQVCCAGSVCNGSLLCQGGACVQPTQGLTGTPCSKNSDCSSGICLPVGQPANGQPAGEAAWTGDVCSTACASASDCVAGWSCAALAGESSDVCQCHYAKETCDDKDNDCDGIVDNEPAVDQACASTQGTGSVCQNGSCVCGSGTTLCGSKCTNTETDPDNCGGCAGQGGVACPTGNECMQGSCACDPGLALCSGTCVNLSTDSAHCGDCGQQCASDQKCADAGCCGLVGTPCSDAGAGPCCGTELCTTQTAEDLDGPAVCCTAGTADCCVGFTGSCTADVQCCLALGGLGGCTGGICCIPPMGTGCEESDECCDGICNNGTCN